MFLEKWWKKLQKKDRDEHLTLSLRKDGRHGASSKREGGSSASYGGMGVRELQLRMELLVDPALGAHKSIFESAKQLAAFAKVDQDRFLDSIDAMCNMDIELAFNFCQFAPRSLQLVDEERWDEWIAHIQNTHHQNGLKAATEAICDVEGYVQSLDYAPNSVVLADVVRILERIVTGLSGRYLTVEIGDECFSDTECIKLPEVASKFTNEEDNFTLYKAMLVHQWAQTWFGTWRINVEAIVNRFKDPERALSIFHKLETIRLDACIKKELPGVARAVQALNDDSKQTSLSKNWERAYEKLAEPGATARDCMFFLEAVYNDEHMPEDKFYQGCLNPAATRLAMNERARKEKHGLRNKLTQLQREIDQASQENAQYGENTLVDRTTGNNAKEFTVHEIEDESMPDGFTLELQYDNKVIQPPAEIQQLLTSILQDFGEIPDDYLLTDDTENEHIPQDEKDSDPPSEPSDDVFLYDEWDHSRQKYRKQWCHLRELDIQPAYNNFASDTLHKYRGLIKHLRRTFEALREDGKRMKRQPFGDDIDLDAVIETYSDTRIGLEASPNLYTKSRKIDRNIAVMFMIDMSGSTSGWINELEREALVLLCESLERLGDQYAIYGFSGVTHKRCEVYRIKKFSENYNQDVQTRIGGITPQEYTRMGTAIRHMSKKLNQMEARTKLLITLSDGRPDDQDGYHGSYGIEDTRRALLEAKFLGIHPFCITIDNEAMDYLQHMYGGVNFAIVSHINKLPYQVSDIYRRITI